MPHTVVERADDRGALLDFLARDRVRNAYPIGSMAAGYRDHTRWFWVKEQGEPQAVLTIYDGLSAPAVFTSGKADALALLVDRLQGHLPGRALLHRYPEHALAFTDHLNLLSTRRVVRMTLAQEDFRPATEPAETARLTHADTAAIMRLFQHYPDSFFEPYQVETGYYYGVREGNGLVSVAGIHMVSEHLRFAMLGNIVTAPEARSGGLARALTSKLCTELFKFADLLVLDVPMGSRAARAAFERLGFVPQFYYDQAMARRRNGTGWVEES